MELTKQIITEIQNQLLPGFTVELTAEKGDLKVHRRPNNKEDIDLVPTLLSDEEPVEMIIMAKKAGEDPVHLISVRVKPGYWVRGIKGAY